MDPWRLMIGTLTSIPVRPPRTVDARVAGRAMALAPVGGLLLAALTAVPLAVLLEVDLGLGSMALAVLVLGALALLTRGMHLDGLADTADGLGSGRSGDAVLEVMKRSDVGPFGVVTLVLVVLLQASALAQAITMGVGPLVLTIALVVSRGLLPVLCTRDFWPARADGLGATVARSVGRGLQAASLAVTAALVVVLVVQATSYSWDFWSPALEFDQAVKLLLAALVGLLPGVVLALRARDRFAGVTGDVYGAAVEVAFAATLLFAVIAL